MAYSLRIHTFPHPTRTDNAVLRVAVYRGAINPFPSPLNALIGPLISSVSEHDLENAALGHALPLLRSLGPSPEDRLRTLANRTDPSKADKGDKGDRSVGLCREAHAATPAPHGGRKGCCRTAPPLPQEGVCLGADPIRCRLGHKEMPECWEAPESFDPTDPFEGLRVGGPDPIEIIRLWREGVYVTTVRG